MKNCIFQLLIHKLLITVYIITVLKTYFEVQEVFNFDMSE